VGNGVKILNRFFLGMLPVLAGVATAATFNLFQPATGILKGNASTYVTTAAASSDVIATFTGTCNNGTYLRGDGTCNTPPGTGVSSVGLTMPSGFSVGGSPVTSSGTLAVTTTLSGVINGTGSGFTAATSANVISLWSGTCNSGTFLRGDGACSAAGTVSSVALTMPGVFSVTGSPVTSSGTLAVAASGTSGGVPYFSGATTMAASAALAANQLVLGGGAGTAPATLGSLGTTTTVLHGNAAGPPTFGAVSLTADITGTLAVGNGGTGATTLTGLLTGNGSSAFTAATSANVIALWSGTCNSGSYLRGDGACAAAGTGTVTSISAGTGITATPDPITTTGSIALAVSEQEASTTSTGTASGCTTSPTQTLRFVKRGNMVIMSLDNPVSCTSNSTSFALTGAIPAGYQPARVQTCFWRGVDNSVDQMVQVGVSSGTSQLTALTVTSSSLWTNSGTKAIGGVGSTCSYALN
jgi:hypothetical protein